VSSTTHLGGPKRNQRYVGGQSKVFHTRRTELDSAFIQTSTKIVLNHYSVVESPYGFVPTREERVPCNNCLPALVVISLLREDLLLYCWLL